VTKPRGVFSRTPEGRRSFPSKRKVNSRGQRCRNLSKGGKEKKRHKITSIRAAEKIKKKEKMREVGEGGGRNPGLEPSRTIRGEKNCAGRQVVLWERRRWGAGRKKIKRKKKGA